MKRKTLKEVTIEAVQKQDAKLAGQIVEQLRNKGFDYQSCQQFFTRCTGIGAHEFESLMYEADSQQI